jgi:hypothetical protein
VPEQAAAHDTSVTAQAIAVSTALSGSLPISTDATTTAYDWYRIDPVTPNPTVVTIAFTGPANQDIDLFLLASDGTTFIAASASLTANESLTQSLAAGTYYIVVAPFSVTAVSNYTLVVQ